MMNILMRKVYNSKDCLPFGFRGHSSVRGITHGVRRIRSANSSYLWGYEFSYCWTNNFYVNNIHANNGLGHSERG